MKDTIAKINKTKSCFFNKIDKPLARLIKRERKMNQVNKIRNKKAEVTTDNTEIQRVINYYEQLFVNKMKNIEEMDQFLEKYNLPKLSLEEIENVKRPITKVKTVIIIIIKKSSSKQKPKARWLHMWILPIT